MTVLIGILMSGAAVVFDLLIEESIQLHLVSALLFAVVPAAAALVVGAMLVALLWLMDIMYDIMRMFLVPGLLWCVCSGTPLFFAGASRLKICIGATFGRTAGMLMQFAGALAIHIQQVLSRVGTRRRSDLEWMSREIALEALWIKQVVGRVLDITLSTACWPIRSSALVILRLCVPVQVGAPDRGSALGVSCPGLALTDHVKANTSRAARAADQQETSSAADQTLSEFEAHESHPRGRGR